MRRRNPNNVHDDPPKDPEILDWFHTLGPPPEGRASPYLHAKVRARIAERRAQRGLFGRLASLGTPAWATALALALVVSVGLNVWWSLPGFGLRLPGSRHAAETGLSDDRAAGHLRTYRFQAEMAGVNALGPVVAAHTPSQEPTAVVGFTPQSARPAFFRMGTLYAEALAALQSGTVEVASSRLDLLAQALDSVQAPPVLAQYLSGLKTLQHSRQYQDGVMARFLALFEPLYEDAYARNDMAESVLLFRAGAWAENLYLAAASGDVAAVRRGGQAVDEVRGLLTRLRVPQESLEALARLRPLVTRPSLTDREMETVRTLVQDVRAQLGA